MKKVKVIGLVIAVLVLLGGVAFYLYLNKMITAPVHYSVKGTENVIVKKDIVYSDKSKVLNTLDIYLPKDYNKKKKYPAVLFVSGDIYGFMAKGLKNWKIYEDYGRMLAASGYIAVVQNRRMSATFSTLIEANEDISAVISKLKSNAFDLNVKGITIWSFSGGGIYLGKILSQHKIRSLITFYSAMNPMVMRKYIPEEITDKKIAEFSMLEFAKKNDTMIPLFIAKAGKDREMINGSIDQLKKILDEKKMTYSFELHKDGEHGFDVLNKNDRTKEIISKALKFLKDNS